MAGMWRGVYKGGVAGDGGETVMSVYWGASECSERWTERLLLITASTAMFSIKDGLVLGDNLPQNFPINGDYKLLVWLCRTLRSALVEFVFSSDIVIMRM